MAGACTFCAIIAGEVAARMVWEDEQTLGFLDSHPVFPGHTLVVPKPHFVTLPELPTELLEPLFGAARTIAGAMPEAMGSDGTFVALNNVVSQSVLHLHVHVVPRKFKDGLRGFFWPRQKYADEAQADAVQQAIKRALTV